MWPDIMNWRMSIVGRYRKDEKMYPFVNKNLEWDLSKENSNLLKEHESSEGKRSAAEMARDLNSFLGIIANLVPDALRPWVLEKSNSFGGIMTMIKDFYKDRESKKRLEVVNVCEDNFLKANNDENVPVNAVAPQDHGHHSLQLAPKHVQSSIKRCFSNYIQCVS